jgi:hypothetical protein
MGERRRSLVPVMRRRVEHALRRGSYDEPLIVGGRVTYVIHDVDLQATTGAGNARKVAVVIAVGSRPSEVLLDAASLNPWVAIASGWASPAVTRRLNGSPVRDAPGSAMSSGE